MTEQTGKVSCIKRMTRYPGILHIALYQPPGCLELLSKARKLTASNVICHQVKSHPPSAGLAGMAGGRRGALQSHAEWSGLCWAGHDPRVKKAGQPASPDPNRSAPETGKGRETYSCRV